MKNKLIIYFFILQFTLQGQSTQMSLNQLLELAKQNNSDVQQSIVKTQSLQYQKKSIALFDKTSLNATMGQNNSFLRDANYQISQNVVNPYKYMLQTKTAQQKIVVNELETESYIKKLHLKISQHWYKALLYKQMKKTIVQEDSLIKEFVRIAEAKVKYGETRPLELSNAKIEAMNVQQEIQEVELMYQQELVAIALLSNQEKIIEPNEDELQLLPTPLSKNVSDQHIGITLANSYLDLAKSNTKVAKFSFLPDFQLGYTIQSFTGPQEVEGVLKYYDSKPRFQSVSFGLTLPLLNWKSNASFRKSSLKDVEIQMNKLQQEKFTLQNQLMQEYKNLDYWQKKHDYILNGLLQNAQLLILQASKGYQAGDIPYTEYLEALRSGYRVQRNYHESIDAINQSILIINYFTQF